MPKIHYFNPDNDLALASGGEHYTPTPRAARMRRDLRLLSAWLADEGEFVLAEDSADRQWLERRVPHVKLITPGQLRLIDQATYCPWGWSKALKNRLIRLGANADHLPNDEQIAEIRQLSHRRLTLRFHQLMTQLHGARYCQSPEELFTLVQARQFARKYPGCYFKQPWSGSGRGIYRALDTSQDRLWQWVDGALRRQGTLMAEPNFDHLMDCATEWNCADGKASFAGFSVFRTDRHSQFVSTRVAPVEVLRDIIALRYPDIETVVKNQQHVLNQLVAPRYDGPLGVDMLLFLDRQNKVGINPCIEVNLRYTMGHVALHLAERGLRGDLSVIPIEKLTSADVPLTPVTESTELTVVVTQSN